MRGWNEGISSSTWYPDRYRNDDPHLTWQALSVSQRRLDIHENPNLLQQNGNGDVAVKREDLAILQAEYVAAGRAHHLAGGRYRSRRDDEVAFMGAVERQLYQDVVAEEISLCMSGNADAYTSTVTP